MFLSQFSHVMGQVVQHVNRKVRMVNFCLGCAVHQRINGANHSAAGSGGERLNTSHTEAFVFWT